MADTRSLGKKRAGALGELGIYEGELWRDWAQELDEPDDVDAL